jgi:phytoene dehydrogenase-like protein
MTVDAVVIGAGPNGLVAANVLADAGWEVLVVEAQPEPGGAVRSGELLEPGFVTDRFSAFYPLAAVSPHLRALDLEAHGLRWRHAPAVLAHPTLDGPAAVLDRDIDVTAAALDRFAPGDGAAWRALMGEWDAIEDALTSALLGPFPPLRAASRFALTAGPRGSLEFARRALLPVRRFAEEQFTGAGGGLLLAGAALHADVAPEATLSGFLGWLLLAIGQRHGWPVPEGGAGSLTAALVRRLEAAGGSVRCNAHVLRIETDRHRATGVRLASGERIEARHGVLADVVAPKLFGDLIEPDVLPARFGRYLRQYQRGAATFKVNWTLDAPIPWTDPEVRRAGTVHLATSMDELTLSAAHLAMGLLPADPFVLLGQMTTADPTRSPAGTESIWAYTDVPQRVTGDAGGSLAGVEAPAAAEAFADRMQARIERMAPGFESSIRVRQVQTPASMERDDANLVNGDKSLGSAQLHQQLVFRPVPGLARPETPIPGLFLASGSAHPGGGVHGACGAHAARAAIWARRRAWFPLRRALPSGAVGQ